MTLSLYSMQNDHDINVPRTSVEFCSRSIVHDDCECQFRRLPRAQHVLREKSALHSGIEHVTDRKRADAQPFRICARINATTAKGARENLRIGSPISAAMKRYAQGFFNSVRKSQRSRPLEHTFPTFFIVRVCVVGRLYLQIHER
jgi:hypothetical protein